MENKKQKYQEFTDLVVWNKAHALVVQIYKITQDFPRKETFRLTDQICRSASSIPANIAEGFGRSSPKEFIRFLLIARGSAKKTLYHLILAKDLGYITNGEFKELEKRCNEISKMLSGLINGIKNSKL